MKKGFYPFFVYACSWAFCLPKDWCWFLHHMVKIYLPLQMRKERCFGLIELLARTEARGASRCGNSVVEVISEMKVVWEINDEVPGTWVKLKWMTCLHELVNGNFIVGNCHAGSDKPQSFEISREKETFGNSINGTWLVTDWRVGRLLKENNPKDCWRGWSACPELIFDSSGVFS